MRGLDPDPVDPDVPGPAGTGRGRTGRGQPHRPDPAVHPRSLITRHPQTVTRYAAAGRAQTDAVREGLASAAGAGGFAGVLRDTPRKRLPAKTQHGQG